MMHPEIKEKLLNVGLTELVEQYESAAAKVRSLDPVYDCDSESGFGELYLVKPAGDGYEEAEKELREIDTKVWDAFAYVNDRDYLTIDDKELIENRLAAREAAGERS